MGTKAPAIPGEDEEPIVKLAKDLSTETSRRSVLKALDLLSERLDDPESRDSVALTFVGAGGLPTLIHHFCGTSPSSPTADPDATQGSVSERAATVLNELLDRKCDMHAVLQAETGLTSPLINMLRAGTLQSRCTAADMLRHLSMATAASTMTEAGVIRLGLSLYIEVQDSSQASLLSAPVAALALLLATSDDGACSELIDLIKAPDIVQAFAATLMVKVRPLYLSHPAPLADSVMLTPRLLAGLFLLGAAGLPVCGVSGVSTLQLPGVG